MTDPKERASRKDIERIGRRSPGRTAAARARSTVIERALEIEPGVEQHAGEDAGEVPRDDDVA